MEVQIYMKSADVMNETVKKKRGYSQNLILRTWE